MKQKALFWVILFSVIAAACAGWYLLRGGGEALTASVWYDGELIGTYDLTAVVIPYEVRIETDLGYNILRVSHGSVEVVEADCSEQVCVRQGPVSDDLLPIVCLPHHLVIQIDG